MTMEESNILDYNVPPKLKTEYADFLTRFTALFMDTIVIGGALVFVFYKLLMSGWLSSIAKEANDYLLLFLYFFGPTLLRSLIYASFESTKYQGTPGKILVGIKVVDKYGNKPTFLRAFARNFGKLISGLIIYIGFFLVLVSDRRQALHDMISNTYVIKK